MRDHFLLTSDWVQVTYDQSGSRIVTAEADKSIKLYREDENAVCRWFGHSII